MIYHTNFDYEHQLNAIAQNKNYQKNRKMNDEFSYLFLWSECNQRKKLLSSLSFSNSYLENLQESLKIDLQVEILDYCPSIESVNWWGKLENIPLELSLNSKIWQSEFFKAKNCPSFLFGDVVDSGSYEANVRSLFRPDYSFAGMGSFTFSGQKKIKTKGVITKWLDKADDISCYINNGKFNYYYNHISAQNSFLGCTVFRDQDDFRAFIIDKGISFEMVSYGFQQTWSCLKKYFPDLQSIQLDGLHTDDNQFFINELNYRKSMGQIALKLLYFFPDRPSLTFNLDRTSRLCPKNTHILLTPQNSYDYQFTTYLTF